MHKLKLKLKLIFQIIFFLLICSSISSNLLYCRANKHKQVSTTSTPIEEKHLTDLIETNEPDLSAVETHLKKIIFNGGSGGKYASLSSVPGNERHHLISSSFCKRHHVYVSRHEAPAISIPKDLHYKTGSHPKSGYNSLYHDLEEYIYNKTNSLRMVCLLGIRDFMRVLKDEGKCSENPKAIIPMSPIKRAREESVLASAKKAKRSRRFGECDHPSSPYTTRFTDTPKFDYQIFWHSMIDASDIETSDDIRLNDLIDSFFKSLIEKSQKL